MAKNRSPRREAAPAKKTLIIIAACVLGAAIIAVAAALPAVALAKKTAESDFLPFDSECDFEAVVEWKKVPFADGYSVEYVRGAAEDTVADEKKIKTLTVSAPKVSIERRKGKLFVRVKPNTKNGRFCDWIEKDIPALKLGTPKVSFDDDGMVRWTPVYYSTESGKKPVPSYKIEYSLECSLYDSPDGESVVMELPKTESGGPLEKDFSPLWLWLDDYYVKKAEGVEEAFNKWQFKIIVKVTALNQKYLLGSLYLNDENEFLNGVYDEGDPGTVEKSITKNIYKKWKSEWENNR